MNSSQVVKTVLALVISMGLLWLWHAVLWRYAPSGVSLPTLSVLIGLPLGVGAAWCVALPGKPGTRPWHIIMALYCVVALGVLIKVVVAVNAMAQQGVPAHWFSGLVSLPAWNVGLMWTWYLRVLLTRPRPVAGEQDAAL